METLESIKKWRQRVVGPQQFELVLETENVAAWMAITNAFTFDWGSAGGEKKRSVPGGGRGPTTHAKDYWNGILVQLGRFRTAETDELMPPFKHIEFLRGDTTVLSLDESHFKEGIVWINIVKRDKGAEEPVRHRDFREWSRLGELKAEDVARPGTLHHYLEPFPGGLTLWPESGYRIDTALSDEPPKHVTHTFTVNVKEPASLRIDVLRLARVDGLPQWQYAPPNSKGSHIAWEPCYTNAKASVQEELAKAPIEMFDRRTVDRIAVTDHIGGGQQIGKNPPQN